jgi:hypothetical protein
MGKRRIRNLQYLKVGEVMGFDLREDRTKEVRFTRFLHLTILTEL